MRSQWNGSQLWPLAALLAVAELLVIVSVAGLAPVRVFSQQDPGATENPPGASNRASRKHTRNRRRATQTGNQPATSATALSPVAILCIIALTLFFGAWMVSALESSRKQLQQSLAASAWPTAPGYIVSSQIKEFGHLDEDEQMMYDYQAEITYRYHVGSAPYTSNRISFATLEETRDRGDAYYWVARYPVDKNVTVHYNPVNPAEAVLETGVLPGIMKPMLTAILVLAVLAGVIVWIVWRQSHPSGDSIATTDRS